MNIKQQFKFKNGVTMANAIALAPMTNTQSHEDGRVSEDEIAWLRRRAKGGFGMVITCASHVLKEGQGWPGQMGIFADELLPGLQSAAQGIRDEGSLGVVQIYHGGIRSPKKLTGLTPQSAIAHAPSDNLPDGADPMSEATIERIIEGFIAAAVRAEKAGFDGIEVHGAHGYLLTQFMDTSNQRSDSWGGSYENRSRIYRRIVRGIRGKVSSSFLVGVRISPESYPGQGGLLLDESLRLSQDLIDDGIDFLHVSLWDVFKDSEQRPGESLLDIFVGAVDGQVPLMVAGKVSRPQQAEDVKNRGADLVALGRVAIGNPDWPHLAGDADYQPAEPPFSESYLREQALGSSFISYMKRWDGFVKAD
ncbi:NADH:flavin oxidoreductase [Pseudobacteriovorax antillogorgiicola]|uniref:2,4-dienoyl-CoA reductase n=1 Tax=Pseudobacteriovorax antillogorgiicola TaxID=1513793 RepID=A0A1Y6CIX3_9BACT|nr:NADH:flavin oxidoreductase [Pseudobacteriovorax antillogorgiicola]TCS46405.1 2,4-dienoyl-CoA reductase-like NADH-dependent reductase (Old Yellow Enzyme family) [Pseudobacteriovorax antillogorgiicola]SMF68840.1 2,4-dienoyl-CoA reductase [Pseudobacteriovorax antillogorgiicola]